MRPAWTALEQRRSADVWRRSQRRYASAVLGPGFEEIVRQWALRFAAPETFGGIVAEASAAVITGPCQPEHVRNSTSSRSGNRRSGTGPAHCSPSARSSGAYPGVAELERLVRARELLAGRPGLDDERRPGCCSPARKGFTDELRRLAEQRSDVVLVDPVQALLRGTRTALQYAGAERLAPGTGRLGVGRVGGGSGSWGRLEGMAARGFPYTDLKDFLAALERAGELTRISAPVDPTLEISEIVTRTVRAGGPALLFERPTRGEMPVAINLFGTEKRMAMALGVGNLDEIGARIGEMLKPELPQGFSGMMGGLGKVMQLKSMPPKKVKTAPCQQVVYRGDDVDLNRLPGLQVWPGDGGIFHNFGLTHTKHPETGKRNLGLYRLQQHSRNSVGMHWQIHKNSTAHHAVAERLGQRLPVAIAIGADPVVAYSASAPLPADIDEYLFAGFLAGERVEMVDCLTVPLQVPASAQIILEGYIEPGERLPEGPFGDHTGFYTPVEPFPVMHIECMTMQRDPVYHSIVTSQPPQEDHGLGKATERIFAPLLRFLIPDIVDYNLPAAGVFHNCAIVSIRKRYPKHAQKVMNAIWGAHMMSLTKLIVIVDEDCDVHDYNEVAFRAFGNVDYARDLMVTEGPVDHLDHASYQQFWGGKAGVDATRKLPEEGYHRDWPESMTMSPEVVSLVDKRWKEYGI